ncbi:hypothetical protein B5M09_008291 [Aphanomyces astaci]|nr:hypothetical protein B5M09_008291 [Aphanomyces astaci]
MQHGLLKEGPHAKAEGRGDVSGGGNRSADTTPNHTTPMFRPRYYSSTTHVPKGSTANHAAHRPVYHGHQPPVDPTSPTSVYNSRRREGLLASHVPFHDTLPPSSTQPPPAFHSSEDFRQRVAADMRISNTTWRDECTDQERESNRCRIVTALRNHAPTYEELLVIVSAIDEELLHITSRAKLQYFDSAMDFHRTLASGCTASSTIPLHRGNGLR